MTVDATYGTCIHCGRVKFIQRRSMCWACYRHRDDPNYMPKEPLPKPEKQFARDSERTEYVLSEWDWLRRFGVTVEDAAPRLGIKPVSLDRALHRALARGDQRGRHECVEWAQRSAAS